jgi:hypothetical protein
MSRRLTNCTQRGKRAQPPRILAGIRENTGIKG